MRYVFTVIQIGESVPELLGNGIYCSHQKVQQELETYTKERWKNSYVNQKDVPEIERIHVEDYKITIICSDGSITIGYCSVADQL